MEQNDELSESDRSMLDALFEYVEAAGWCPMPAPWNRLWGMLLARHRECGEPLPGPPLILAAWHEAPLVRKRVRLLDQLEWAAENGILAQVDRYLRSLPEQDWFQGDAMPDRERTEASELGGRLSAAIAAVTDCAAQMLAEARKRRNELVEEVAAWRRAGEIRAYVAAVRAEAEGRRTLSAELLAWEEWALRVAEQMDPVRRG